MKFAIAFAFQPIKDLCPLAVAAEDAGFDMVALSDHVVHPQEVKSPYPYTHDGGLRWEPFTDWPDAWVSIGAMAAVTRKLEFTTNIFVLPMRNPFLVAKAVATAAAISENRVSLGIGVGWMKDEFLLLEQDFHTRGKRTNEMLEVLRKLWAGGWVEHHGKFYDFEPLEMSPVPEREVPIYCGGLSDPALKRSAQLCDGWVSDLHTNDELVEIRAKLDAYRAESDRADRPFEMIASSLEAYDLDSFKRLRDTGAVTYAMSMPWALYLGERNVSFQDKVDSMHRFADEIIEKL